MVENRPYAGCVLSIALLLSAYLAFMHAPLQGDEVYHTAQIHGLLAGNFTHHRNLTTIPGYHYVLFALAKVSGWQTDAGLRFFSLLFGIGCVSLVWRLTASGYRTLLFTCLPIIFPFLFLVYTDIASLFFVLLGLYLIGARRYTSAGLAAITACLMRQTSVVWLVFLGVYAYVDEHGFAFDDRKKKWMVRKLWSFALGVVLFVMFLVWNHGNVSLRDLRSHPTGPLHMSNVWFMLFVFALLFLPFAVPKALETLRRFWRRPWFWAAACGVCVFYLVSFTNTHHYNVKYGEYFIRNAILIFATQDLAHKLLAFIPVFIALAALVSTKLERPAQYLLYPASVLFLIPSWLVEQRYYIIPLTLFLACSQSFCFPEGSSREVMVYKLVNWIWISVLVIACGGLLMFMAEERWFL